MVKWLILTGMVMLIWGWGGEVLGESYVQNDSDWVWYGKNGDVYKAKDLDSLIANHQLWLSLKDSIAKEYGVKRAIILNALIDENKMEAVENDSLKKKIEEYSENNKRLKLLYADLSCCSLKTKTNLDFAIFQGAKLKSVCFVEVMANYSDFHDTDCRNADMRRAQIKKCDFSSATLDSVNFSKADINGADFYCSSMKYTMFRENWFMWANFKRANLTEADVSGLNLVGIELDSADLSGANFEGRTFYNEVKLLHVNLREANFTDADLKEIDFTSADLKHAIFEPDFLPKTENIARAQNLDFLDWNQSSAKISELKKSLFEDGFRTASKQVNAALRRKNANILEYVLFDLTCEYGSNYWIPILALGGCILGFSVVYFFSIVGYTESHKYLITTKGGLSREFPEGIEHFTRLSKDFTKAGVAALFSLQRTLRLGFRDYSPTHWLTMILPPDYSFHSRGFIRFVSAFQSILSVYLIIMMLVSYFGRLFD